MATCSFCTATVPDGAQKCMHCGEWLTPRRPTDPKGGKDGLQTIGEAAKTGVAVYAALAVAGLVVSLVFFLAFFLPSWDRAEKRQDEIFQKVNQEWPKPEPKDDGGTRKFDADRERFLREARPMRPDEVQGMLNGK